MLSQDVLVAVGEAARTYNIPHEHLAAVVDVESNGKIFATVDGRQEPLVLFEPHVFYRRLSGDKLDEAVKKGLAYPKWGTKPYPKTQTERWRQIHRAIDVDPIAAFESVSFGVGQVMGFHWKALGYTSVKALVDDARSGIKGQIRLMMRYIVTNKLDDELREGRWAAFARGYNGPGYAKNKYDKKLERAAALYGSEAPKPNGMLRMGSKGARVLEVQKLLVRAGYHVTPDSDFGPATKKALVEFQGKHGLKADGVYGPATERALSEFRQGKDENLGSSKLLDISKVKAGLGAAVASPVAIEAAKAAIQDASSQIAAAGIQSVVIDYIMSGLSMASALLAVAGVGFAAYGWLKSHQTKVV